MTATELLVLTKSADISIDVQGDRLIVDAPPGALTPELRTELARQKPTLLALLAPVRDFVPLRGGLTIPLPALLLALDLERRRFRLALDAAGQIVVERTEDTAELAELSDGDEAAINRWGRHLGALIRYDADAHGRPQ